MGDGRRGRIWGLLLAGLVLAAGCDQPIGLTREEMRRRHPNSAAHLSLPPPAIPPTRLSSYYFLYADREAEGQLVDRQIGYLIGYTHNPTSRKAPINDYEIYLVYDLDNNLVGTIHADGATYRRNTFTGHDDLVGHYEVLGGEGIRQLLDIDARYSVSAETETRRQQRERR